MEYNGKNPARLRSQYHLTSTHYYLKSQWYPLRLSRVCDIFNVNSLKDCKSVLTETYIPGNIWHKFQEIQIPGGTYGVDRLSKYNGSHLAYTPPFLKVELQSDHRDFKITSRLSKLRFNGSYMKYRYIIKCNCYKDSVFKNTQTWQSDLFDDHDHPVLNYVRTVRVQNINQYDKIYFHVYMYSTNYPDGDINMSMYGKNSPTYMIDTSSTRNQTLRVDTVGLSWENKQVRQIKIKINPYLPDANYNIKYTINDTTYTLDVNRPYIDQRAANEFNVFVGDSCTSGSTIRVQVTKIYRGNSSKTIYNKYSNTITVD